MDRITRNREHVLTHNLRCYLKQETARTRAHEQRKRFLRSQLSHFKAILNGFLKIFSSARETAQRAVFPNLSSCYPVYPEKFVLFVLCTFTLNLQAEPWGKDADLAIHCEMFETYKCPTPILGHISELLVRFHQEIISPCDGPRSHFKPSSSQYAIDAIRKYGFATGFGLGCDRLMRENKEEWVYRKTVDGAGHSIKYNPVP